MGSNVIFFGWHRTIPGREKVSLEHFQEFRGYLEGLQQKGSISSFDPVILNPHGGDLNGFILIRGDHAKLDALTATTEWATHMIRATLHLQGSGAVRGQTGELIQEVMSLFSASLPR